MSKHSDIDAITDAAAGWVARRDAGLSASEAAEFEQWLAADARHEAAFESCARTWAVLRRPLLAGEQNALARELQARARRRLARRTRVAAAASAVVAVIFAFAFLWQRPSVPSRPLADAEAQSSGQTHRDSGLATVTSPEQRVLPDGSTMELNQDAVIDVRYDDAVRRVVLIGGEAHFQVMKDSSRSFVVVAGGVEVRAVGTAFAVGLGAEQVEVWVTEGRVAVEKPAVPPDPASGEAVAVTADTDGEKPVAPATAKPVLMATLGMRERVVVETASWAAAPAVTAVTPAEINERLSWRVSRLEFSATPLAEAVALINRHSLLPDGSANARLVLDASLSGLKGEPVSGYFYANDIASFVAALNVIMGVESERRGGEIVLLKRGK